MKYTHSLYVVWPDGTCSPLDFWLNEDDEFEIFNLSQHSLEVDNLQETYGTRN